MSDRTQRLMKRQQRLAEKGQNQVKIPTIQSLNLNLGSIGPITDNQVATFDAYNKGDHLFLHGCPGTGKTFVSMYLALKQLSERHSDLKKLVIIRSAQSSKDMGFLPGDEKKKMEIYENPYKSICSELYNRGDAYDMLTHRGLIEFHSTSFLRGNTIDNAIILLDEVQNLRWQEIYTVLSRTGDKSKVIVCGDTKQDDLTSERHKEKSGIRDLLRVFSQMKDTSLIQFNEDDIVRSGFVRELVLTMNKLGI